jgi:hypothetical protein
MADSNTTDFVNVTSTFVVNGKIVEKFPPIWPFNGSFNTAGTQTTPGITRGALINSGVYITNSEVAHVCDFKFNITGGFSLSALIPNLGLILGAIKNGKHAAAAAIRAVLARLNQLFRLAIDALLSSLNLDITGVFAAQFSLAKKIVREINEKIKVIAQIVADVAMVYYLIQGIKDIVNWIKSLPSKIQKILIECLTNFTNSVGNIAKQVTGSITNTQNSITSSIANALTADQGNAPQPSSAISKAISDPVNANIDSLNSTISNGIAAGKAAVANTFANQKANSSKP